MKLLLGFQSKSTYPKPKSTAGYYCDSRRTWSAPVSGSGLPGGLAASGLDLPAVRVDRFNDLLDG